MAAYILRRIFWTLPVLWAVATITFLLMHSVPGGPWDGTKPIDPIVRANLEHEYGLDRPLWYQYGKYMFGLAHGDLGISITEQRNRPVRDLLADKIRVSASLGLLSLALSVSIGVALGVASALRRNTPLDYAAVGFATLSASVPSLILGMLMLAVFTGHYHWLPSSGWSGPKSTIMPVIALSTLPTAYISRVTRAAMLDVLDEDYVRTARAKGLRMRVIVARHMLRNALIPVITIAGPIAAALVTGSFIVEYLFSIPGIGFTFITSISQRDYGVIMGVALFYTFVVVGSNIVVDVLYAFIDPRIRYEAHG